MWKTSLAFGSAGLAVLLTANATLTGFAPARAADPGFGAKMFLQCRACHAVGANDGNGFGPNLNGVVGAKAGSRAGYVYSAAMAKSGIVWTPAKLDAFLARPSAVVPGTKMAFAGIANPKVRDDLVAYLAAQKGAKR